MSGPVPSAGYVRRHLHPAIPTVLQRTSCGRLRASPRSPLVLVADNHRAAWGKPPLHRLPAHLSKARRLHERASCRAAFSPAFPLRVMAAACVQARHCSTEAPSRAPCFQAESRGRARLEALPHKGFEDMPGNAASSLAPRLRFTTFRSGNAAPSRDVLIRQSGRHRRMRPGQAGRLRLVTHAAPRRDRRLMLLDEVAEPLVLVQRMWTRCAI